jgi:putative flippase GtrA
MGAVLRSATGRIVIMRAIAQLSIGRLSRFAIVGFLGTVFYYALLVFLAELCDAPVMVATGAAFIVVVLTNYILHYSWTFRSSAPHGMAISRFVFMSFIGFWLNWGIMFWGVERLHFGYIWVQAVAIGVVVVWNFTLSVKWIFGSAADRKKEPVSEVETCA